MMINDHDDSDDKDHDISECMPLSHFQYEIGQWSLTAALILLG